MLLVQPLCDIRLSGLVMINAFFEIYAHLSRMQCRILVADCRNRENSGCKTLCVRSDEYEADYFNIAL